MNERGMSIWARASMSQTREELERGGGARTTPLGKFWAYA
jgi:hypothetical protein